VIAAAPGTVAGEAGCVWLADPVLHRRSLCRQPYLTIPARHKRIIATRTCMLGAVTSSADPAAA
jgi:hypothetical protein